MKVVYLGKSSPLALIRDRVYEVMAEERGWYRIIDETGEDYLYPKTLFRSAENVQLPSA
jgi:hypothetical protein